MLATNNRPTTEEDDLDAPVARLTKLAASFENTLASLYQQIALAQGGEPTDVLTAKAREAAVRILALRKNLRRLCGRDLMPDAAFDIALEIFSFQVRGQKMGVMDVCADLDVADSTVRRWLQKMEAADLVDRVEDPDDHRRSWVSLRPDVCESLRLMLQTFS
jgi:DNA-binding transcriptional ArsR family regulator